MKDLFGGEIVERKTISKKIHPAKPKAKEDKQEADYSGIGLNASWKNFASDNSRGNSTPLTVRERIIKEFSVSPESHGNYDKLKSCLITHGNYDQIIDDWFKGVIASLYFRPNHLALIFQGEEVKPFVQKLLYDTTVYKGSLYENLIQCVDFTDKSELNVVLQDNFTTSEGEYPCDKRLSSYCCCVTSWVYPKRKDYGIIPIERVDLSLLEQVDMLECWREIFIKFKPEDK